MNVSGNSPSRHGLELCGITKWRHAHWNLTAAQSIEIALHRGEGMLSTTGALCVKTGRYTGRSPTDKFTVEEPSSKDQIAWGKVNSPLSEESFDKLYAKLIKHAADKEIFVRDCFAGASEKYRVPVRVVTELAWQDAFVDRMFIVPPRGGTAYHMPEYTVLCFPSCHADPKTDGTNSEAFIVVHFGKRLVLIGGSAYAGEIKKSVFTIMNYVLPQQGVLSMHCSANVGPKGDTALFFGLSGTGKTTLSADPDRQLIGDDEHAWTENGVFNIEGGCYAKCIHLSWRTEPQIYDAVRYGAIAENVDVSEDLRLINFDSDKYTENTRVAYPLWYIDHAKSPSIGGHPRNILFLTCDAFAVLPPISKLTAEQAMYHFLSGYTAKVAGTERGVTEPQATFSTCFGEPFLPLPPREYATMLGEQIERRNVACWLVNTGWTGGPYGVGERMPIRYTRAMISAALNGELAGSGFDADPVFGVGVPRECADVTVKILTPRNTWADKAAYDVKARELAKLFAANFKRFKEVPSEIAAAGPKM